MLLSNGVSWTAFVTREQKHGAGERRIFDALNMLRPTTATPAITPVPSAFNWGEIASAVIDQTIDWFVVAFRSVRLPNADSDTLYVVDALAHAEARVSGGLLAYYYSGLDAENRGLAMCVWETAAAARAASTRPLHLRASELARVMYLSYEIDLFSLTKPCGEYRLSFESMHAQRPKA